MKISYNWLRQYIEIPESPQELSEILTSTGLEVEHLEKFESVKGGMRGLVIGQVLTCAKHPNADKLSLTTVDVGGKLPLNIVCGASNVSAGQKVVVARVGTTLHPYKGAPVEIKSAKIRGELSEGMICAEDEMGLGASHDGILVLKADAVVGSAAADHFGIYSDFVFEIGLTPNRADAASHIGVARDIKAARDRVIKWPSVDAFKADSNNLSIKIVVENEEACPRYSGLTISGLRIAESPDWLKNSLQSIGLTPINNVVDITNFVCHELGQPLHAFDADEISGKKVLVKTLPARTKFVTLDGKERTLTASDLMICDAQSRGMCIAGVFGGATSGITSKTKNIFLEAATFSPAYIRKTSMHHQLKTDASFRFERGTDPEMTVFALKRAALLILEIGGGTVSSEVVDVYPRKVENAVFQVRNRNVDRLIGRAIPREEILRILDRLDIKVVSTGPDGFTVSVPAYRVDVRQEADIVEEVLRIYGFNRIELSETASADFISPFEDKDPDQYRRAVGEMLAGSGFYEIVTNSLTRSSYFEKYDLDEGYQPVVILNKLSEDQGALRTNMLLSGLEICSFNINRKQKNLKLFEFGKVYGRRNGRYVERPRLALFMTGQAEPEHWLNKNRSVVYHDLSLAVAQVLEKSAIARYSMDEISDAAFDYGMKILSGKDEIGKLGKVKTVFQKDFGIKQEIFYADLDAALLFKFANPKFDVQDVPKFPEVRRDLSLVLDKHVVYREIEELVRDTEKKLIKDIIVFDVYEGEKIPDGKKAYALGFTLLDENKTLTDEEIDGAMNRLIGAFESKMNAVIRK